MEHPAVSIILPTLNRAELLKVSIGSVLAQTFSDFELIVVDDGSDDDIDLAVAAFTDSRIKCVRRHTTGGPAAARNTGLEHARGRYIAFQDSDDEWMLDKLANQMSALSLQDTDVMCVGSLIRRFGDMIRLYRPESSEPTGELGVRDIVGNPISYTQTWLVPRKALLEIGGFDERFRIWEDWDLLLRLSKILRIRPCPSSLVYSERLPDSLTSNAGAFLNAINILLPKHEETFSQFRREKSELHYMCARRLHNCGRQHEARSELWKSLKCNMRLLKAWVVLFMMLTKTDFIINRLSRFYAALNRRQR